MIKIVERADFLRADESFKTEEERKSKEPFGKSEVVEQLLAL
jgi:hypothetical protein